MMTSNNFKKGYTMMVLKQKFLNDVTKSLKRVLYDDTKTVQKSSKMMVLKKGSTMMVLKTFQKVLQ